MDTLRRLLVTLALVGLVAGCDDGEDMDAGPGFDAGPGGDTDAGPGGDTDAGPGGDTDAGPGGGSDGGFDVGSCTAVPATIEPSCDFTPCGGALDGSWCYTSLCIAQADLFGGFAGCMASDVDWSGVTGTVTGRVMFDGTTVRRVAMTDLSGTLGIPPSCVPIPGLCAGTVSMALNMALAPDGSATCMDASAGGCTCDVTLSIGIDSSDTYTVAGDQFTADGRTFDYCVEGDGSLNIRETGDMAEEPALQSFSPE